MQKRRSKPFVAFVSSTILCVATLAPVSSLPTDRAFAQETRAVAQDSSKALRIVGVWDSRVTITDPDTGATLRTFRALEMFITGGSFTDVNTESIVPPSRGPSVGRWEYLGNGRYAASFRFFRFTPDGTFAGTQHVSRVITLQPGAQEYTSEVSVEILDVNDNVIRNLVGAETSTRVVD